MGTVLKNRDDLVALLQGKSHGFSETFRKIAAFILSDYRRACFMTAQELAEVAGVSQPSVTRFAAYLGFRGFPEFQRSLQQLVRHEMTGPDRMQALVERHSDGIPYGDLLREEIRNLDRLTETLASPVFQQVAANLAEADTVVVAGFRASAALAEYTAFFLAKVHPRVRALTHGDSTALEALLPLEPENTAVLVHAFPRYPRETQAFQRFAADQGFPVVLITDNPLSPLVAQARWVLAAPVAFGSLFDSYCAPIALTNALVQEVAKRHPERTRHRLARFEEMAARHGVFLSNDLSSARELP
ncbi:MAG: MurR/RpiR family transcriptional regulator [Firmicutes bacterium]|nr:MurR/RpiR family transcriptional regulator [Bacillota bacterium]